MPTGLSRDNRTANTPTVDTDGPPTGGLDRDEKQAVMDNLGLVHHIVTRVMHRFPSSYTRDDLVQVGTLGLIEAVRRFDPERGVRFSSFAGRRIEGAITDHLRSTDWAPRSVRSQQRRLASAEATGARSDEDISRISGLDIESVRRTRDDVRRARIDSFEYRQAGGVDVAGPNTVDESLLHREQLSELRQALAQLTSRHRMLVESHFLDGRSLTEIGQSMGVTQSRASQLKSEALAELRRIMARSTYV